MKQVRYINTKVTDRWLRMRGIPFTRCSACADDEMNGIPMGEFNLGKGRWTYACCGTWYALCEAVKKEKKK